MDLEENIAPGILRVNFDISAVNEAGNCGLRNPRRRFIEDRPFDPSHELKLIAQVVNIDNEPLLVRQVELVRQCFAKVNEFFPSVARLQLVILVFCCIDSDIQANKYGESPKYYLEETEQNESI